MVKPCKTAESVNLLNQFSIVFLLSKVKIIHSRLNMDYPLLLLVLSIVSPGFINF